MTSEIEVVEEAEPRQQSPIDSDKAATEEEDDSQRDDVYTAAAYGDMEKLQRLVEREGCSVSEPDALGYSALQWAALNNRSAAARYILEHGGDVHAVDHTGQTALHWSAVRGATKVAELLLQEGARVNAADMYGYQKKVAFPCGVCTGKGFYKCKLCNGKSTIEWSPLFDPVVINPCLYPTCDGNSSKLTHYDGLRSLHI